jgi:hypothetical protein
MRIINATLDSISIWYGEDEEKKAREKAAKVEKRRVALEKVGITVDATDLSKSITLSLTEMQLADLMVLGESLTVSSSFDVAANPVMRAAEVIEAAARKLDAFANSVPDVNAQYNERVEVYTPGMGLMLFNRVMLLQDACSDALQSEMDNGWRIVAACPQPDQRRPDYILGRYDPAYALESGAGHSALRG